MNRFVNRLYVSVLATGVIMLSTPAFACPICNVDGVQTRRFIFWVFLPFFLACGSLLIWAFSRHHFDQVEQPKHRVLELDRDTEVRL